MSNFFKRLAKANIGDTGRASERRVIKTLGAQATPASGATVGSKGDARMKGRRKVRIEAKSTIADTMKLDMGWLSKISGEAATDGSMPAVTISFTNPDGSPRMRLNAQWVMIPLVDFQELMEE